VFIFVFVSVITFLGSEIIYALIFNFDGGFRQKIESSRYYGRSKEKTPSTFKNNLRETRIFTKKN